MIRFVCFTAMLTLAGTVANAGEPDDSGLAGVSFSDDKRAEVREALNKQAEKPSEGGELPMTLYVKTQERLAESFDQPIPEKLGESTRD